MKGRTMFNANQAARLSKFHKWEKSLFFNPIDAAINRYFNNKIHKEVRDGKFGAHIVINHNENFKKDCLELKINCEDFCYLLAKNLKERYLYSVELSFFKYSTDLQCVFDIRWDM